MKKYLAIVVFSLLAACATRPVSPEDYVQSARAQVGAVYQTIGDLKATKQINQDETKRAIAKTEKVEQQVDNADALLLKGDISNAQGIAKTALVLLLEIQSTLPKPKGK